MRTNLFPSRPIRTPVTAVVMALGVVLLSACPPFDFDAGPAPTPNPGYDQDARMCIPAATGVPGVSGPPTVDGTVLDDLGWTRAFRFSIGNVGSNKAGAFQTIRRADTVYVSIEIDDAVTLTEADRVLLAFSPENVASERRLLIIQPFAGPTTGSATNVAVASIISLKGEPPSTWSAEPAPPSLTARVSYAAAGAVASWSMELSFLGAELDLPPTDFFGMYMNAIVVNGAVDPAAGEQYTWPEARPLTGPLGWFTPQQGIPAVASWGNVSRSPNAPCYGVFFAVGDISADPPPESQLSLTDPNVFRVDVYNTSRRTGAFIAAPDVRATFRIANFGLGAGWSTVPTGNNPTQPDTIPAAASIAAPGSAQLSTNAWSAGSEYAANLHQCILVELDSNDPNVTFINRSRWRNMNFQTTASPFRAQAEIRTEGFRLPRGERAHTFLLTVDAYNTPPEQRWDWTLTGAERIGERTYRVVVPDGRTHQLDMVITPPNVRIPGRRITIPPGTGRGGQGVQVPVQPGELLTFVTRGAVGLGQMERRGTPRGGPRGQALVVGPNGVDLSHVGLRGLPLEGRHSPASRVGALIGRWDGLDQGTFVIGSGSSVKVPSGARSLTLMINDTEEGFAQHARGPGFVLQVIQTRTRPEFARTNSMVGRDPAHEFVHLPVGVNLPSWRVCARRKTGQQVRLGEREVEMYEDAGCFGYMINQIGQ